MLWKALCALLAIFSGAQAKPTYGEALDASMQFYEAQRSGKLLRSNRVTWRGDSLLKDREPGGKCVTGGVFDAGDNVKFLLPFGWSTTVIAWGAYEFREGYAQSGLSGSVREVLRWASDFAMQCYVSDTSVVGGIGDGDADHAQWGRPEDVAAPSKFYMLSPDKPGSDVAGSLSSALASSAMVFSKTDPSYARKLLRSAVALYRFGVKYPGKYSDSHPDLGKFYKSSNYHDELAWAAAFIWKASGRAAFRDAALRHLGDYVKQSGVPWNNFDWDSAYWGALSLLQSHDPTLSSNVTAFVRAWTEGTNGVTVTPSGLSWSFEWGSLRQNANAQFYALVNARNDPDVKCWAKKQADYILGISPRSPRSFVVGLGDNPPCRPHHRGASCRGTGCSWNDFNSPDCNPNVIRGALVGGPGKDDSYADKRDDFQKNEVAVDYNAGWTSALAGLLATPLGDCSN